MMDVEIDGTVAGAAAVPVARKSPGAQGLPFVAAEVVRMAHADDGGPIDGPLKPVSLGPHR